MQELEPGEDVRFNEPADVGGNYEAFERMTLLRIGAGLGLPYDMLTGDLSKTSYSSIRAGILSFRRLCEQIQYSVFIHQFCRPIWRAFIEQAAVAGKLDASDYRAHPEEYLAVEWHTPKWAWVDPEKDVKAEIMAIRAGLRHWWRGTIGPLTICCRSVGSKRRNGTCSTAHTGRYRKGSTTVRTCRAVGAVRDHREGRAFQNHGLGADSQTGRTTGDEESQRRSCEG